MPIPRRNTSPSEQAEQRALSSLPGIPAGGPSPFVSPLCESNYPVAFPADTQFRRGNREAIGRVSGTGGKRKR